MIKNMLTVFLIVFLFKNEIVRASVNEATIELQCTNKSMYFYLCTNDHLGVNVTANTSLTISSITGNYNSIIKASILKVTIRDGVLPSLPSKIAKFFPELFHFTVVRSALEGIKRVHFSGMESLRYLNLRHNKLSVLSDDVFLFLINLQKIDLSDNAITFLPSEMFTSMFFLTKVIVNDNFIELFDSDTFQDNKKLEEVHLWQNKIKAIRFDAKKMKNLSIIDVRGNVCIDELFYIQGNVTVTGIQNTINQNCSSYVKLPGQLVYRLSRAFRRH